MTEIARDTDSDSQPAGKRPQTPSGLKASRPGWQQFYARGVLVTDIAVLALTSLAAQVWRFGTNSSVTANGPFHISYTTLSSAIVLMWFITLQIFQTRDARILGDGPDEYSRVTRATVLVFGWVAILSLVFKWDMSRGYLAIAFPLGLVGLILGRKAWRIWLRNHRRHGRHISNVLIVGGARSALDITTTVMRHPESGLNVTGVWQPDDPVAEYHWLEVPGKFIPVMGTDRTLAQALSLSDADTVIVTDTEHLGKTGLRELTWQLEGIELYVSPNVMDVSGARIHMKAVASMPLLHLEEPQYAGASAWPKAVFDRVVALGLLMLTLPVLMAAAVAVKLSGQGSILFRQSRIGIDGTSFDMLKFRTMRVGAENEHAAMMASLGGDKEPMFKVKDDPRITRAGRILRRLSIDELPQLVNVLRGEMSVVGPRPQLQAEVDLYDHHAYRRLRVRPGMTGLWQVSGRSDLSWEDAIRLDTYYVENWSLAGDLVILWKTVRAVIRSDGAY